MCPVLPRFHLKKKKKKEIKDTLLNSSRTNSPVGSIGGKYVALLEIMGLDLAGPAFNLWTRWSYEISRV